MLARPLLFALAAGLLASACSKSEPPPPAKPPPAPKVAAAPAPVAPAKSEAEAIDEGLKERLARQEAAAKMFESNVLNPAPPKVPEPPKEPAAARPAPVPAAQPAAPPKVAATPPEVKLAPPASATPSVTARSDPPKAAAPAPAPAVPSPAPRTDLAAARPSAAPEPQATRLVAKVDPDFPREAVVAGVDQGVVKARMTLDASGSVTRVEVLDANPRRVFDRAVVRALSQWRYSEGASGRTVDMEVAFRR